jgi:hypothetical protein
VTDSRPPADALSRALLDYAEPLLIGTGLNVEQALLIARGEVETPSELAALADALRAGWSLAAGPDAV